LIPAISISRFPVKCKQKEYEGIMDKFKTEKMRMDKVRVDKLKIEEKLRLLNGKDFWTTYGNAEAGIRPLVFSDGPAGLRFQEGENDHLGLNESSEATCFPTPSALACSWDPGLAEEVAACIAEEAAEKGVDVVLAPGVNIKRSPLCGRNFEYFSEDPVLTRELGTAYVKGLQKRGIGSSLKHFAANNQEAYRMSVDVRIDERALHEIYLKAFREIIGEAGPWTVMSAYNKLLGEYCSENAWLLTDLLRKEWGYDGLVISDWSAVNDIVQSIHSGLDLEMPSVGDLSFHLLKEAYADGKLDEDAVNRAVNNIIGLIKKCDNTRKKPKRADYGKHHQLARKAAAESFVLLKNQRRSLPVKPEEKILFVGERMTSPVIQGNGSSRVHPVSVDSIPEELARAGLQYAFEPGYRAGDGEAEREDGGVECEDGRIEDKVNEGDGRTEREDGGLERGNGRTKREDDEIDEALAEKAVIAAKSADKIIFFAGLPRFAEAESYDRESLRLPRRQDDLIRRLSQLGKELVVVLQTGSTVEMPWIGSVDSVLQMHLSGQGAGKALADILSGKANPSGKLTETYPEKLSHTPSYLHRGDNTRVEYGESIFTGYRYYDKKGLDVLFPFGHGLSYTEFTYDAFRVERSGEHFRVALKVTNTGTFEGKEIVQVYAGLNESAAIQPVRRLIAFRKIALRPGESAEVAFTLSVREFMYYDVRQKEFVYATGKNTLEIGRSSRCIEWRGTVEITESNRRYGRIHRNTTLGELQNIAVLRETVDEWLNALLRQFGVNGGEVVNARELERSLFYMPLRNAVQVSNGEFSFDQLDRFIDMLNHKLEETGLLSRS
jgi:beta-glucosidase